MGQAPRPALILGSTQPDDLIDRHRAEADDIDVCRRRSGGGLVYVDPKTDCWIDAILPPGSPLWSDDVGQAFHWIGHHWAQAIKSELADLTSGTTPQLEVFSPTADSAPRAGRRQRPLWCFADMGHGEVSIDGYKVVGLSQRRTRNWTRLQTMVLGNWPGRDLARYLIET